jgi:pimeloyl-ACP methyl ester carboxylesterase
MLETSEQSGPPSLDEMPSSISTESKPVVVIVPASFSPPSLYQQVVDDLDGHGYTATTITLLSVTNDRPIPPATLIDDADHIKSVTSKLVDEGKDIIMVMHSYGGVCGTEAVHDIIKSKRVQDGKDGGVIELLYISSPVPRVGGSVATEMGDHMPEFFKVDASAPNQFERDSFDNATDSDGYIQGEYMSVELEGCARNFFSDLPLAKGIEFSREMKAHSTASFSGTLTQPAYCLVPVSYLMCEDDEAVPAQVQKAAVVRIEEASGRQVKVYSCKAGHFPVVSQPAEVVRVIRQVAGEGLS